MDHKIRRAVSFVLGSDMIPVGIVGDVRLSQISALIFYYVTSLKKWDMCLE